MKKFFGKPHRLTDDQIVKKTGYRTVTVFCRLGNRLSIKDFWLHFFFSTIKFLNCHAFPKKKLFQKCVLVHKNPVICEIQNTVKPFFTKKIVVVATFKILKWRKLCNFRKVFERAFLWMVSCKILKWWNLSILGKFVECLFPWMASWKMLKWQTLGIFGQVVERAFLWVMRCKVLKWWKISILGKFVECAFLWLAEPQNALMVKFRYFWKIDGMCIWLLKLWKQVLQPHLVSRRLVYKKKSTND